MHFVRYWLSALIGLIACSTFASADHISSTPSPALTNRLIENSCVHCHEGDEAEGGLDLTSLSGDLSDARTLETWVRIHDRVRDGEMPPPEDDELSAATKRKFTRATGSWISDFQTRKFQSVGRVNGRRLTNSELERTLQDLFAIDLPLASIMPAEPRSDGFIGVAEAQSMSHFQLETHVKVVDAALDAAFDRLVVPDKPFVRDLGPKQIARKNTKRRNRQPEMRKGVAVTWASRMPFYGQITTTRVPEDGWYRMTVTASGIKPPQGRDIWCTVRSGACVSGDPAMYWIGSLAATKSKTKHTYEAWIQAGHMIEIRPGDATNKIAKFKGGQVGIGEGEPQNVPGVAMHAITMERIYPGGDLPTVRKKLLGGLNVAIDRKRGTIELRSKNPVAATMRQLGAFMKRALRGPIPSNVARAYTRMLRQSIASGEDPITALRSTYRAVLCSPRFIYRIESCDDSQGGSTRLDQFSIANRLSYFLTGTMPDPELFQLAENGQLNDPQVLRQQVDRLLDRRRSNRSAFVEDFAAQWLDLMDIDFTEPDPRLYDKFDLVVQHAMLDETHLFLNEMVTENLPIENLVRSDFTYLNRRLARFYDVAGLDGNETQRVPLAPDSVRGGLLAHGSILKVTANGTTTSPVLRGVWISERILGTEIPPPPENVPAVEPDIRGASTIRDQLQKHVADVQCAACHRKIDPPGYALENFDPAGQWRETYYYRKAKGKNKRPKIDSSFVMPSGEPFSDFNQFRDLVCADPDAIARNVVEKLVVYGTGANVEFADRKAVDAIVDKTRSDNHGMKSLIHAVVSSPIFLSK